MKGFHTEWGCSDAAAAVDHRLSSRVGLCMFQTKSDEWRFIHYCQASSADTWRIEPSDQKTVMIYGSSPQRADPRDDTRVEDKGDDGLTSSPCAPVYDINERKKRDETEWRRRESRQRLMMCVRVGNEEKK